MLIQVFNNGINIFVRILFSCHSYDAFCKNARGFSALDKEHEAEHLMQQKYKDFGQYVYYRIF